MKKLNQVNIITPSKRIYLKLIIIKTSMVQSWHGGFKERGHWVVSASGGATLELRVGGGASDGGRSTRE